MALAFRWEIFAPAKFFLFLVGRYSVRFAPPRGRKSLGGREFAGGSGAILAEYRPGGGTLCEAPGALFVRSSTMLRSEKTSFAQGRLRTDPRPKTEPSSLLEFASGKFCARLWGAPMRSSKSLAFCAIASQDLALIAGEIMGRAGQNGSSLLIFWRAYAAAGLGGVIYRCTVTEILA